jgi:hypothetical protein
LEHHPNWGLVLVRTASARAPPTDDDLRELANMMEHSLAHLLALLRSGESIYCWV